MSSPAERADKVREALVDASLVFDGEGFAVKASETHRVSLLLPPGSLVFHTRTEILEWLRGEGLVVLDKDDAEKALTLVNLVDTGSTRATLADKFYVLALLSAGRGRSEP